jgi:hypothetical protein
LNVITTFKEKRREKQIKYERTVLRDLSIKLLKSRVQDSFCSSRITSGLIMNSGIEEACYDIAIEAYLLGAKFSRFSHFGEKLEDIRLRCHQEEKHLIDTLYNFLLYWGSGDEGILSEGLYYTCEQYVRVWWEDGYRNADRRRKLRLH